jgi:hypothetical protein
MDKKIIPNYKVTFVELISMFNKSWILIGSIIFALVLILAAVSVLIVFMLKLSDAHYVTDWGEPVDYVNFKREDYNVLPVVKHPFEKSKWAKVQKPFFIVGIGCFICFKACDAKGKITHGAHEFVKCICKKPAFKCGWHAKVDECKGNFSHPCSAPMPKSSESGLLSKGPISLANIAHPQMHEILRDKHIDFVLDANISFSKATSSKFYDFVHTAMEFARRNPLTRVTDIFRKIDRTTLSREVKSSGESRLAAILQWLRGKAFRYSLSCPQPSEKGMRTHARPPRKKA